MVSMKSFSYFSGQTYTNTSCPCHSLTINNNTSLYCSIYREKWSLFDESTHVPIIIAHPLSPFKGQRYPHPVELIDVFPTINDLLAAPFNKKTIYGTHSRHHGGSGFSRVSIPLQGKSLAPLILGRQFKYRAGRTNSKIIYNGDAMPSLNQSFALSQTWRCSKSNVADLDPRTNSSVRGQFMQWDICDAQVTSMPDEVSVMGYSMRTLDYRYTQYIPFHRMKRIPIFDEPIYAEELYDHRGDVMGDLGKRELVNLALDSQYSSVLLSYRSTLRDFLYNEVVYLNLTRTFREINLPPESLEKKMKKISLSHEKVKKTSKYKNDRYRE